MELTDSHCHIQSVGAPTGEAMTRERWAKAGDTDPDAVIRRADEAGVTRLVCVGCDLEDSQLAVSFVENRSNTWASIGIHPHEADRYVDNKESKRTFAALGKAPKVVAVGECGLDYFYTHSSKASQLKMLHFQLELALEYDLPLIFHVREAYDEFWPVFEEYHRGNQRLRGVLHSFTDTQANLERGLSHGLFIGVNGIATFTKNADQQVIYRTLPPEYMLLETDAPFLTPAPNRGTICEPYHIRTIAEFLAEERTMSVSALAETTTRNARHLFGI